MAGRKGSVRSRAAVLVAGSFSCALLLALVPQARADVYAPNKLGDHAPNGCTHKDCTLREAVIAANGHAGKDAIDFSSRLSGKTITLTEGSLEVAHRLTIAGPGASKLTVSGNDESRIFHMTAGAVTLRGLTITAGREAASPTGPTCPGASASAYTAGGGILEDAGNLKLRDVTVSDSAVRGPSVSIIGGGGIADIEGRLSLIHSRVSGGDVNGGAISGGGGILNCVGVVSLTRSTVKSAAVSADSIGEGGGIANGLGGAQSTGKLELNKTTVAGNRLSSGAISEGGGVITTGGPVKVERSTIARNRATVTGAGAISSGGGFEDANSKVTLTNSTISDNKAIAPVASGGGIDVGGSGKELSLRSSTLAENTAQGTSSSHGGNLDGSGAASLRNTIVAGGVATSGSNCDGAVMSSGHDIEDADTCGLHAGGDQVNSNPKLGQLKDNGGPTKTIALKRRSPAINHASKATSPRRDQRGFNRDQKPDIGAYEFGAKPKHRGRHRR